MAQTGFTPIVLYNSGTTTNAPIAADLTAGELGLNYKDGLLFYKDDANAIQKIGYKLTPIAAGGTGAITAQLAINALVGSVTNGYLVQGTGTNIVLATAPTFNQDTTGKSAKTDALSSATTVVNVSSATAPTNGQVLTATSGTAATWQAPAAPADVAAQTHAATSKTTPADADEIPLADSAASFGLKKLTWANLKASLPSSSYAVTVVTLTTQTAVASNHYILTNVAATNVTLPAGTSGDTVWVTWTNGLATNTVTPAGAETIMAVAGAMTLDALINGTVQLRFVNSSWRIL